MNKIDVLHPLYNKKVSKKNIISFDIETYGMENKFLLGGIYDDEGYKSFINKGDMIDYFTNRDNRELFKNSFIAATNLDFDFQALFYGWKYYQRFKQIYSNSKIIFAIYNSPDHMGKLWLIDTLNFTPLSVEKMGKALNIHKLEYKNIGNIPKNPVEWNELMEYNKRDCLITKKYSELIQDEMITSKGKMRVTAASSSMDLFRRAYLKAPIYKEQLFIQKKSVNDLLFKAYYGGRTEIFKRGFVKNIKVYDFNSLYPSVMLNDYPKPDSAKFVTYPHKDILEYEGVSCVELDIPYSFIPILPYRREKLLFPYGHIKKSCYTNIEIRKAIEYGAKVKTIYWTIFYKKTFPYFKDYVTDSYKKRLEYQKENNPLQQIQKLYMNTLYGKFAQRHKQEFKYIDLETSEDREQDWKDIRDDTYTKHLDISMTGYISKDVRHDADFQIPIFSIYTTAYGRLKLWDIMNKYDGYYVDTDSLFTRKELPTSEALGDLKLEREIKKGILIKPKSYYIMDKDDMDIIKLKGIRGANMNIFFDILKQKKINYKKFSRIRESINKGILPNSIIDSAKKISLEDNKRIWKQSFNPYILDENSSPHMI